MGNASMQSSSTKRKQLHPKKQIIMKAVSSENTHEATTKSEVSSSSSSHTNLESSVIDSSAASSKTSIEQTAQNVVTSETEVDVISPQDDKEEIKFTELGEKAISDSLEMNQTDASINIETMKCNLKRKLDIPLMNSNLNDEHIARISLSQRRRIMEQKMRKFFANASLQTTIIRNTKELTEKKNVQYNNFSNEKGIENSIGKKNLEIQQMMLKMKNGESTNKIELKKDVNLSLKDKSNPDIKEEFDVDVLCTALKNKVVLTSNKNDGKTKQSMQEIKIDRNDTMKSAFNEMENDCDKLLIKKVIITPRITNGTNKSKEEFDAVIEVAVPLNSMGKNKIDTAKKEDEHVSLNKTDEKINSDPSAVNSEDTSSYVACLQTVRPVSAIKAIASIKKLKEVSSEKIRETSRNILDYNIEMINLMNKLTQKTYRNNIANGTSPKISMNKLEDALEFTIGKKPRTITIIRKPKESFDANTKLSIMYIDGLDSALNNALGNNSKLLPFVKQLINSSVSNFIKTNPSNINIPGHKLVNIKNLHKYFTKKNVALRTNRSKSTTGQEESIASNIMNSKSKETSDTKISSGFGSSDIPKNQNAKSMNALGKLPETNFTLNKKVVKNEIIQKKMIKYQTNNAVPVVQLSSDDKKKINIISIQKGLALKNFAAIAKSSQVDGKYIKTAYGNKPIILKRVLKTNSNANTAGFILENLSNKKSAIQNLPGTSNSAVATGKTATNSLDNCENELGVSPSVPRILRRIVKTNLTNEISGHSNLKRLHIIDPIRLIKTTKPIILKKLIKKSSVGQTYPIAVGLQKNVNANENIKRPDEHVEASNFTVKQPEAAVKTNMKDTKNAKKQFLEITNPKTKDENSHIENPNNLKRKNSELDTRKENIAEAKQPRFEHEEEAGTSKKAETSTKVLNLTENDEIPPLKRPKMMTIVNEKINPESFKSTIKQTKLTNSVLDTIADVSSLQICIKTILESDIYNQITAPNFFVKLDTTSNSNYDIKGLSNFILMHEAIVSVLESPGYQQVLALAKGSGNSRANDENRSTGLLMLQENSLPTIDTSTTPILPKIQSPIIETNSLLDPNSLDVATSSSAVPATLLPQFDKDENEEIFEKLVMEHI